MTELNTNELRDAVKEAKRFTPATPIDVMERLLVLALRAEAGVRSKQRQGAATGFYAGKRAGFVKSAATMASMLFGADHDEARHIFTKVLSMANESWDLSEMRDQEKASQLAREAVQIMLQAPPAKL